jgi:AcrR family transcriptional regulator
MSTAPEAKRKARTGAGRPRADEAERKKAAMLDAALAEFAECGFNAASLRVIASKADVSTRTLLNHYPTKAALFGGCLDHVSERFTDVVTIRRPTLEETLVDYGMAMHESLSSEDSRQIAMLIYRESSVFPEVRQIARLQFETYQVAPVVQILKDFGHSSDHLRETAIQFVAMAFGQWQRHLLFGDTTITADTTRAHLSRVTRIFLQGIGEPAAPPPRLRAP